MNSIEKKSIQASWTCFKTRSLAAEIFITQANKKSPDDYHELMKKKDVILEGIAQGEQALINGQVLSNEEAQGKMSKWLE